MKKLTVWPIRKKFNGKWYYLSPKTNVVVSKSEADRIAQSYREMGSPARVVKVNIHQTLKVPKGKGGSYRYLVYAKGELPKYVTKKTITRDSKTAHKTKRYYCRKCRKWHNKSSKIGRKHSPHLTPTVTP